MDFMDDHPVVSHRVRFENRVEITEDQARLVKDDMVVAWLVRARCQPPQYYPVVTDGEDRYRFNIQSVEAAVPLAGGLREQSLVYIEHGSNQSYMEFGVPRFRQEDLFGDNEGLDPAQHQLDTLASYLNNVGEFREDETPVEAFRRLFDALRARLGKRERQPEVPTTGLAELAERMWGQPDE